MRTKLNFFILAIAALAASCHEIYAVKVPAVLTAGTPFSIEVTTKALPAMSWSAQPIGCIRIPSGVQILGVQGGHSTPGSFPEATSLSAFYHSADSTKMADNHGTPGTQWHCYRSPDQYFQYGDIGFITFSLTATAPGKYSLAFATGSEYTEDIVKNRLPTGEIVERVISVGAPTHYLDDWQAVPVQMPLYEVYVAADTLLGYSQSDTGIAVSADGITWADSGRYWPDGNAPIQVLRAQDKTWLLYSSRIYEFGVTAPTLVYTALDLRSLAFDGERFIVVGDGGLLATSPTGEAGTWTEIAIGTHDLNNVATQDGVSVIGGNGVILYPNGATWSVAPVSMGFVSVAAHWGRFWATDTLGTVMTASVGNPEFWSAEVVPGSPYRASSAHGFLFMGGNGNTGERLHVSANNGMTWDQFAGGVPHSGFVPAEFGEMLVLNKYSTIRPHFKPKGQQEFTAALGSQTTKQIAIDVDGRGDAMFAAMGSGGGGPFTVDNYSCDGVTLPAHKLRCLLTVTFTPETTETYVTVFSHEITWPTYKRFDLTLVGTGLLPLPQVEETNQAPSVPTLVRPAHGEANLQGPVRFVWKESVDPDGDAVAYRLFVCEFETFEGCDPVATESASAAQPLGGMFGMLAGLAMFGAVLLRKQGVTAVAFVLMLGLGCGSDDKLPEPKRVEEAPLLDDEKEFQVEGLKPGIKYYWKVVADDSKEGIAESEVRLFTTAP